MTTLAISDVVWSYPASWLEYNLWTLSNQSVPPTEIMVMDASINPAYHQAYAEVCARYPLAVHVHIPQAWPNYAYCQNVGIQTSHSEYMGFINMDRLFSYHYTEEVYKHLSPKCMINSNARFLPMGLDLGDPNTIFDRWDYLMSITLPQDKIQVGTLICVARDWLIKARGFDEYYTPFLYSDSDLMGRHETDGGDVPFFLDEREASVLHIGHPPSVNMGYGGSYPDPNWPALRNPNGWGNER